MRELIAQRSTEYCRVECELSSFNITTHTMCRICLCSLHAYAYTSVKSTWKLQMIQMYFWISISNFNCACHTAYYLYAMYEFVYEYKIYKYIWGIRFVCTQIILSLNAIIVLVQANECWFKQMKTAKWQFKNNINAYNTIELNTLSIFLSHHNFAWFVSVYVLIS